MDCKGYKEKGIQVAEKLQSYCNSEGWKEAKEGKGWKIFYKKSEEFDGYLYKGEAHFNAPPKTVFEYVEPLPDGPRLKWDKTMKNIEILKQIDKDVRINRASTHSAAMGLISPRDFVDLIYINETDKYFSTNAVSIEFDEYPPQKKYQRGWNYNCGIIVFKLSNDPNKCKLVSLIQPDIKGMVPKSLVDSTIPGSMQDFFTQLRQALQDDSKLVE